MRVEEKREFIINVIYYLFIFVLGYFITKYFLGVLFPFVLGFLIAFVLKPLTKWIKKKLNTNSKVITLIVLLLFYALIGTMFFLLIFRGTSLLKTLFEDFPEIFARNIEPLANQFNEWISNLSERISPEILKFFKQFDQSIIEQLNNFVKNFSNSAISFLSSLVTKIPSFFIAFFFTIISSFLIALDYDKIVDFLNLQTTGKNHNLFVEIQSNAIDTIVNYIKAYAIILSLTFVEAALGLSILKVSNAFGIAIVIALVDIFPVFGTGTVLIPWAIIEIFNKRASLGIGLFVLYAIITVVRQILEPRIVGESIGLYPIVTLISMYLGTLYFGIGGLFVLPIIVTVVVKLQEDEVISFYKVKKKEE